MPHPRLLLVLLCLPLACVDNSPIHAQTPSQSMSSANLVGEYRQNMPYSGSTLKLLPNGQYTYYLASDVASDCKDTGGNYSFHEGVIVLSPGYLIVGQQTVPPNERAREPLSSPVLRFLPVRWGQRLYLLQLGVDELSFCNAVNAGDEPLPASAPRNFHPFLMRLGDEKHPVRGQPELPAQWRAYLLPRPVKAKVVWIQKDKSLIVNVGSANNIRVGMQFTNNRQRLNDYTVVSVSAHRAVLKSYETSAHIESALSTHRAYPMWKR